MSLNDSDVTCMQPAKQPSSNKVKGHINTLERTFKVSQTLIKVRKDAFWDVFTLQTSGNEAELGKHRNCPLRLKIYPFMSKMQQESWDF